jgi:hypothetical protein
MDHIYGHSTEDITMKEVGNEFHPKPANKKLQKFWVTKLIAAVPLMSSRFNTSIAKRTGKIFKYNSCIHTGLKLRHHTPPLIYKGRGLCLVQGTLTNR